MKATIQFPRGRVNSLLRKLQNRIRKVSGNPSVIVGYTANYAVYVHENLNVAHKVGQAKFLEQPLRELSDELAGLIARAMKAGSSLGDGLLLAGLRLQRESQKLVPVDTGNLKGSAFTKKE